MSAKPKRMQDFSFSAFQNKENNKNIIESQTWVELLLFRKGYPEQQ
ncbi:hypothetical protein [Chryseobacterium sp.]|nr:hypothetical protein [Chryseobacterium sp.]